MKTIETRIQELVTDWLTNERWKGIERPYTAEEVVKLQGSYKIEHSIAKFGAEKLWKKLNAQDYVAGLGALTGNQAIQEVEAGLEAIYLSGWQVAADANVAGEMYPDQSLYPANSVPLVVKRINNALLRADQIQSVNKIQNKKDYLVPIVADAEAGFGGNLNAFELMKALIEAGAAAAPGMTGSSRLLLSVKLLPEKAAESWRHGSPPPGSSPQSPSLCPARRNNRRICITFCKRVRAMS